MIVMKFGGTSVGSAERIRQAAEIVRERLDRKPVVVVSAVGGVTDLIINNALSAVNGKYDMNAIREKHSRIIEELALDSNLINNELDEIEGLGINRTSNILNGVAGSAECSRRHQSQRHGCWCASAWTPGARRLLSGRSPASYRSLPATS